MADLSRVKQSIPVQEEDNITIAIIEIKHKFPRVRKLQLSRT